jgi:phenylalanyl-tRNA synthetase beta chain
MLPERYEMASVPAFPPVLEDLAIVVDEIVPADRVAELIRQSAARRR